MRLFNTHKFSIEILDDEIADPEELAMWIAEAVSLHCEVQCVTVEMVEADPYEYAEA